MLEEDLLRDDHEDDFYGEILLQGRFSLLPQCFYHPSYDP